MLKCKLVDTLRLILIHPNSDMMLIKNKTTMTQIANELDKWTSSFIQTLKGRRAIENAVCALIAGNLPQANKYFNQARYIDSTLVDMYLNQLLVKFPEKYKFTDKQFDQLFLLPAIFKSWDIDTLMLLADKLAEKNSVLSEVMCALALRQNPYLEQRIGINAKSKEFSNLSQHNKPDENARSELLAIANIKTNKKIKLFFSDPLHKIATQIIDMLEHRYDRWVEHQYLIKFCVELINDNVLLNDPLFSALLSAAKTSIPISEFKAKAFN